MHGNVHFHQFYTHKTKDSKFYLSHINAFKNSKIHTQTCIMGIFNFTCNEKKYNVCENKKEKCS